jgi:hypothetical protein
MSHFLSFATLGRRKNLWHISTDSIYEARRSLIEHDRLNACMKAGDPPRRHGADRELSGHFDLRFQRIGAARGEGAGLTRRGSTCSWHMIENSVRLG